MTRTPQQAGEVPSPRVQVGGAVVQRPCRAPRVLKVVDYRKLAACEDPAFARSVLVVEDEPLLCDLIVRALQARGFEVVAARSAVEATRIFHSIDPDAVVMDIDLGPGPNGFDLAETFVAAETGVAVVFLTHLPDPRFAGRRPTREASDIAYLRKGAVHDVDALVQALDSAMRGAVQSDLRHDRDPSRPLASLTRAQIEILRMVALGRTNAQIAEARGTSEKAVERLVGRALLALGIDEDLPVNRRVDAARRFMDLAGPPVPITEGL